MRPVEDIGPVQTGVWYSPDLVWLAFDGIVGTSSGPRWMSRAELEDLLAGVAWHACLWRVEAIGRS